MTHFDKAEINIRYCVSSIRVLRTDSMQAEMSYTAYYFIDETIIEMY